MTDELIGAVWTLASVCVGIVIGCLIALAWGQDGEPPSAPEPGPETPSPYEFLELDDVYEFLGDVDR